MRRLAILLALLLAGSAPGVSQESLRAVAESARRSLERGDLPGLLRSSDRIQLQLPSAQPSGAVGAGQAEAALRGLLGRGADPRVRLIRFREVGRDRGYVELRREYRTVGGGEARGQQVLLGYRRAEGGWVLVEVRVF